MDCAEIYMKGTQSYRTAIAGQYKKRCKRAQKSLNINNEVVNDNKFESGSAASPGTTNKSREYTMPQSVVAYSLPGFSDYNSYSKRSSAISNSCNICHILYGIQ